MGYLPNKIHIFHVMIVISIYYSSEEIHFLWEKPTRLFFRQSCVPYCMKLHSPLLLMISYWIHPRISKQMLMNEQKVIYPARLSGIGPSLLHVYVHVGDPSGKKTNHSEEASVLHWCGEDNMRTRRGESILLYLQVIKKVFPEKEITGLSLKV